MPLAVDFIPEISVTCNVWDEVVLPEKAEIVYNDRSANTEVPVTWDETQLAAIDTEKAGSYKVDGTLEDGSKVTAAVEVEMINYVVNPGFEEEDTSMWSISYEGTANPTDYQVKEDDAYSGEVALHFWSGDSDMDFSVEQTLEDLEAGTYQLSVYAQGGDMSDDSDLELYAVVNGEEVQAVPFMVTTWTDWKLPTIKDLKIADGDMLTIGVRMKCNVGSWGTLDDFTLIRIGD